MFIIINIIKYYTSSTSSLLLNKDYCHCYLWEDGCLQKAHAQASIDITIAKWKEFLNIVNRCLFNLLMLPFHVTSFLTKDEKTDLAVYDYDIIHNGIS